MLEHDDVATERKRKVSRYFRRTPDSRVLRRATVLLSLGTPALAAMIPLFFINSFFTRTSAIFLLAIGFVLTVRGLEIRAKYHERFHASEPKPTDREIDDLLAQDIQHARERAMVSLDLVLDDIELKSRHLDVASALNGDALSARRDRAPLVVYGPGLTKHTVIAGDGFWRFGAYEIMVICPTERHLALYVCAIDFFTGGFTFEATHEFHYVDIVAVRTTTSPEDDQDFRYVDRKHRDEVHFAQKLVRTFQIVVSSGDRAGVPVGIVDKRHPDHEEKVQRVDIEGVVKVVRQLLRNKKAGLTRPLWHVS